VDGSEDTPRSAFALFSWRINLAVVACLLVFSVVAWLRTVDDARSMSGMVMGLGHIGLLTHGEMGATMFLVMWTVMMVAMMLPTVAPMVLTHLAVVRKRGGGIFPTIVFVAGYLAVWSASGVVPYLAQVGFSQLTAEAAESRWLPALAGGILVAAGAYQFTGWKQVCLGKCQSPFAFIITHDFDRGARSALRAGIDHGAFCLGCCWALMTVLLVVGLMNLVWMIGLFLVFLAEKNSVHGLAVAKVTGAALVVLGVVVVARPDVLSAIS
jgi:predicted metal-binding membrane protein